MDPRISDDLARRDIPSFIEQPPPLILNPFMVPRPVKGTNLMDKFEEISIDSDEPESVQVYLRMKPSNVPNSLYEIKSDKCLVTSLDTATAGHGRRTQHNVMKMYTFTRIFKPECNQKQIFEEVVKDNLRKLVDGHSFTLLTYGASGSGKTYTVMGTVNSPGLVPRALEYLFKIVDAAQTPSLKPSENGAEELIYKQQEFEIQWVKRLRQVSAPIRDKYRRMSAQLHKDMTISNVDLANRTKYYVWVSFVEIYNENIYDLLAPQDKKTKLRIREDSSGNVYVKGVTQAFVRSSDEAYDVMVAGKNNLMVAATGIHAQSSRSHCIFTITMLTENDGEIRSSQVRLCDLAGCERQRAAKNTGARMQESRAINSSLHVLEKCLHMVRRKQRLTGSCSMVPYRESKLTRLLGAGLSGAKGEAISMVVTVNPAPQHAHETKHVLALASVARDIQINTTMATTFASLESSTQESTLYSNEEVLKLRVDNERLHFELVQAHNRIAQLQIAMDEKQQENANIMREIVEDTRESLRVFYERRLAALTSRMEDMRDEYESKSAEKDEIIFNLQWKISTKRKLSERRTSRIEEMRNEIAENEENDDESATTSPEPTEEDEVAIKDVSEESDNENENTDAFEESLEPAHKQNIKTVNRSRLSLILQRDPSVMEPVIVLDDSIEEKTEEVDDDIANNEELKAKENVSSSRDSLYATGDEDSETGNQSKHEQISSGLTPNLSQTTNEKSGKIVTASADVEKDVVDDMKLNKSEVNTAESDMDNFESNKNESEALFNVSTKLDKSLDKCSKLSVRETYFVSNEPEKNKNTQESKTINSLRGTYFIADNDVSFYKQTDFTNDSVKDTAIEAQQYPSRNEKSQIRDNEPPTNDDKSQTAENKSSARNEIHSTRIEKSPINKQSSIISEMSPKKKKESQEKIDKSPENKKESPEKTRHQKPSTQFGEPKKVSEAHMRKLLKSMKTRQSSFSSLKQFEQLEMAIKDIENSPESVASINLTSARLATFKEKKAYFADSLHIRVSNDIHEAEEFSNDDEKCDEKNTEQSLKHVNNDKADDDKIYVLSSSNLYFPSSAAKEQNKRMYEYTEKSTTNRKGQEISESINDNSDNDEKKNVLTPTVKQAKLYFDESDKEVPKDVLISKSPSLARNDFEPSIAVKKILGENFAKPELLSSVRKDVAPKKHTSVDIFESPHVNIPNELCKEVMKSNIDVTEKSDQVITKDNPSQTISFANVKESTIEIARQFINAVVEEVNLNADIKKEEVTLERTTFTERSSTGKNENVEENSNKSYVRNTNDTPTIKIEPPLNDSQGSNKNNTVDEFENIVKDLTNSRATEFDLLVSETSATTDLNPKSNEQEQTTSKHNEMSDKTKEFEEVKYNLRNKGKCLNLSKDKKDDESFKIAEAEKAKLTKRSLRLRRRKERNDSNPDQESDGKLKNILNLEKEFSDVTLGVPAVKKVVNDIPSPEKMPGEEENLPPMMGIQSCPSKSVTRSRRKLFTPRAEPLEESPSQVTQGDSNERLYIPRPSYHRVRARRKL